MFFGQINAPATLPIYVLTHLVNNKFLSRLHGTLEPITCFVFMLYNEAFVFLLIINMPQKWWVDNI